MKRLTFDFETRSCSNLKAEGAYKYSCDPTTQPTCMAFKFYDGAHVYLLKFNAINRKWLDQPEQLRVLWGGAIDKGFEFSAHNAFFERCIYNNILVKRLGWPVIPFNKYRCTAAKAAACALPRNLEGAGAALNLTTQKDKRGYAAMMLTCKPTKKYVAAEKKKSWIMPKMFLEPEDNIDVWNTLYEYCKIDVKTEELLDRSLPDLNPEEQEIWHLNQKLNWRGLRIDIPTVEKIVGIMEVESKQKLRELDTLTMGLVTKPGARKSILEFLALEGIELPDIKAKTVDDALTGGKLSPDMKRLLEIRKALSKTSTRKYQAFLNRAMPDARCRDILLYHGASTGRDTGAGIQPHNFPRGAIKFEKETPYEPVNNVVECDHEMLKLLYGESLAILFSSILRNMIIPSEGHELFVADFSKIEVAVLWWLASNEPGLKILRSGRDPYKYQAAENTGKAYEDILDESDDRQLAKAQILACGFGMGWPKFQKTAFDQYRLKLTDEQSRKAVKNYREANAAVPELWKSYEAAAIQVVENGQGSLTVAGKCRFINHKKFLWVELPSGRKLAYREPRVAMRMRQYEVPETVLDKNGNPKLDAEGNEIKIITTKISGPHKTLEFMAVNSKTKKWSLERTWGGTLTENIVQAVARDLMMSASVRLENAGYKFLLSVHDEGITEKPIGEGNILEFTKIMTLKPKWAGDMPVEAKGWKGERYRK